MLILAHLRDDPRDDLDELNFQRLLSSLKHGNGARARRSLSNLSMYAGFPASHVSLPEWFHTVSHLLPSVELPEGKKHIGCMGHTWDSFGNKWDN